MYTKRTPQRYMLYKQMVKTKPTDPLHSEKTPAAQILTQKTDKEKTILPNKTLLFGNSKSEVAFYLSTYFLLSARNLDFLLR